MKIVVPPHWANRTVKEYCKRCLGVSTTQLNRIKQREGGILLNGSPVFTNAVLSKGDLLEIDLSDPPAFTPLVPIPMELEIPYEDEDLLVVNKPAPLPVHRSSFAPGEPTLAQGLAARLGVSTPFHPVNRLDRGTTGLMVVAKSSYIHNRFRQQLHTDAFYREYRGISIGVPDPPKGRITLPIARAEGSAIKRCITPSGAAAVTDYETLCTVNGLSLLRLIHRTGRTHQIRLHLSAMGCPLAGDWLYGREEPERIPRPALHSAVLSFRHPITGKMISLEAPIPSDMMRLLTGE